MSNQRQSDIHHRRSIRLKDYDYTWSGAYYITICTRNRECLLGTITDGQIHLNSYGQIVVEEWYQTANRRPNVMLDEFVVMPNHFHGIVILQTDDQESNHAKSSQSRTIQAKSLSAIVRAFKSAVTKRIHETQPPPHLTIWQRNYYEHIIRNDTALAAIRQYIGDNPFKWDEDEYNPTYKRNEPSTGLSKRRPYAW